MRGRELLNAHCVPPRLVPSSATTMPDTDANGYVNVALDFARALGGVEFGRP